MMSERYKWATCKCDYCLQTFRASRQDARFCSANCRKRYNRIKQNISRSASSAISQIAEMRRLADKLRDDERVWLDLQLARIENFLDPGSVTLAGDTDKGADISVPTQRGTEKQRPILSVSPAVVTDSTR
jgi:hypothetical protein